MAAAPAFMPCDRNMALGAILARSATFDDLMSNRFVRQIDPRPKDDAVTPKRMSEYSETANIILVGDPGSGKSHLFEELAQAAKSTVLSARAFLNTPGPAEATLFVDALDERRAGRTDQATIDQIV